MSMQHYAFSTYGILLNGLVDDEILDELAENEDISHQFSFTGEAFSVKDSGVEDWGDSKYFNDESIYYLELPKHPGLFEAPYTGMKQLIAAMTRMYRKVPDLPKLTPSKIRERFKSIQGTYYG